nr:hypothetical protein [Tanacetum cinerariifolium]
MALGKDESNPFIVDSILKTICPSPKTSNSSPRVTAALAPVVSAAKGKKGKWGNPQYALKDKGVIDSGCSRHMTGNMSYLSEFEESLNKVSHVSYNFKCWLSHHTTNGSQFTMSNPHKN